LEKAKNANTVPVRPVQIANTRQDALAKNVQVGPQTVEELQMLPQMVVNREEILSFVRLKNKPPRSIHYSVIIQNFKFTDKSWSNIVYGQQSGGTKLFGSLLFNQNSLLGI